eukprot:9238946-Pyramimonas_sp.AAC.1
MCGWRRASALLPPLPLPAAMVVAVGRRLGCLAGALGCACVGASACASAGAPAQLLSRRPASRPATSRPPPQPASLPPRP